MEVSIMKKDNIQKFDLPKKVKGVYWINDNDDRKSTLINLEGIDNKWILKSNSEMTVIYGNKEYSSIVLVEYEFYYLKIKGEKEYTILYCSPSNDKSFNKFIFNQECELLIGNDVSNAINYMKPLVSKNQAKLFYKSGFWGLETLDTNNSIYVNGNSVKNVRLYNGDIIFVWGLKIIIVGNILLINNPMNLVTFMQGLLIWTPPVMPNIVVDPNQDIGNLYKKEDYFLRSPRFRTKIEHKDITIEAPPNAEKKEEMPVILTMGPMITMSMTSVVMGGFSIMNVMNGTQPLSSAIPSLVMAGAMLLSSLLWPSLTRGFQNRLRRKKEKERQKKYKLYLNKKQKQIVDLMEFQKKIHITNNLSYNDCKNIIMTKHMRLWERRVEDDDFLHIRIGIGNIAPDITIKSPDEKFTMEEDNLATMLDETVKKLEEIKNVPIGFSLVEKTVSAIVEKDLLTTQFLENIILQLVALHSYDDLKIVFITNEKNAKKWNYIKTLPHCWNNEKTLRFFASNKDEAQEISNYLTEVFNSRTVGEDNKQKKVDYKEVKPYYVIITDNLVEARTLKIFDNILESKTNAGFSIIIKHNKLANLPDQCTTFLNINEGDSAFFENELASNNQKIFVADLNKTINMEEIAIKLANVPIEFNATGFELPTALGFLEMFGVGNIEQLNITDRWKMSNPTVSLAAPIGYGETGDLFKLDIHEKFHGPHGLVAGMTGSGKSEFLIAWILSLAVNYHPDEVQFVLIDYKGGGLAGAFYNEDAGIYLPHLAGTITNLDKAEINRSLASIESELKRRQHLFNVARDKLNESTIDIYKYQRLYREGLVDVPISHLLIISDEFAELKSQQPEFMDQLISTARIGRSLGVHLILATQKPSGVVNDQIWSNSKFKICLKVQDKSDSQDMIKCPDAALLKETGRFYLQVGYNEFFALGQSAWCGTQYIPKDKPKKKIDTSVNFINNTGSIIKSLVDVSNENNESKGEELPNIVRELNTIRESENIKIKKLWLDKISPLIYVDELSKKYNYSTKEFFINPIIGEYDDPSTQSQGLLTLNLSDNGNTLICGMSGSGKELLLSSIIYSIISNHSPEEANFYIMDFGAEILNKFALSPHVGNVILSTEEEKIGNLLKYLEEELNKRKKLFSEFGGNYKAFIENSETKLPMIITILNYYDNFVELYNNYDEVISKLTREGEKYGIVFIVTANASNSIRFKMKQNFRQSITLQLNDEMDYTDLVGAKRGMEPSKIFGRGLIGLEGVFEFQTSHITSDDNLNEFVKNLCTELKQKYNKTAYKIPVLPDIVNFEFAKEYIGDITKVPVGVVKESLDVYKYNFRDRFFTLVTGDDIDLLKPFTNTLLNVVNEIPGTVQLVFDINKMCNINNENIRYTSEEFDNMFTMLNGAIDNLVQKYGNSEPTDAAEIIVYITEFSKLKDKLNSDNKMKLDEIFKKAKNTKRISFVLVDSIANVKTISYESWYKDNIDDKEAIWIGNGISNQFTIKLASTPRSLYDQIEDDLGYIVVKGNTILTKLLSIEKESE